MDAGDESTSVSSVLSPSPFFLYCTVVLDGVVMLIVTASLIECCESVGLCVGGVSVSSMFSRSPTETLLASS